MNKSCDEVALRDAGICISCKQSHTSGRYRCPSCRPGKHHPPKGFWSEIEYNQPDKVLANVHNLSVKTIKLHRLARGIKHQPGRPRK